MSKRKPKLKRRELLAEVDFLNSEIFRLQTEVSILKIEAAEARDNCRILRRRLSDALDRLDAQKGPGGSNV